MNVLNKSVTHVVILEDHHQEIIDEIQDTKYETIVMEKWLIDCAKHQKKLVASKYAMNNLSRTNNINETTLNDS